MRTVIRSLYAGLLALACVWPAPARAAESYDNCTGFIDSVPATITTQGTWCLRKDLSTAITSGNAITIATNNVTIDCNHFKLGGLQAGDSSQTNGMYGDILNTTVRNCTIRGFLRGLYLFGGGHLVEDNRLDQNLFTGIGVYGENNLVRRNQVFDTGGSANGNSSGIYASAEIKDNTVSGVFATGLDTYPSGIVIIGTGSVARENQVRGVVATGIGYAFGINAGGVGVRLEMNNVAASSTTRGYGVYGSSSTVCVNNSVINYQIPYTNCPGNSGNISLP